MHIDSEALSKAIELTEHSADIPLIDKIKRMSYGNRIFVTADLHLFDKRILQIENRPFKDIEDMHETIIKNWNEKVSRADCVYVLGDVGNPSHNLKKVVNQLKGYKVLIWGNHDEERGVGFWRDVGFNEVYRLPVILNDYIILSHKPPEYISDSSPYGYIYGHVHSTDMYRTVTQNTACVCVERWDYMPVSIDKIMTLWRDYHENSGISGEF